VKIFTREYIGALLWDIEVQISNPDSLAAHALCASIEEANKKQFLILHQQSRLPTVLSAAEKAQSTHISGRKTISYNNDMNEPTISPISYDHPHTMEKAITTLSQLGFMLRNLNNEFITRYIDELLLADKHAKAIGSPTLVTSAKLSPIIGSGNKNFSKYSVIWGFLPLL
jgi:hypothetical protein